MAGIPASHHDLLGAPNVATVATIRPDGTPHQTVTWVDYDGEHVLVNTVAERRKAKNVRANPHAGINVIDPDDVGRYLSVSGPAEVTTEGAVEHANELGRAYRGVENFADQFDDVTRVVIRVEPAHVVAQ
ncbi:MAG: PPOX class F420-dependent oxidoreductase [Halobacteriales archaeon]